MPVGRRIAYDPERGRLWIVCLRCAGWNLTPFSRRWEALDDSERLFGVARRLASSEEVTWARVAGIDLIRVGHPTRREFASWRYGSRFGRRRRIAWVYGAVGALSLAGITVGGVITGAGVIVMGYGYLLAGAHLRGDAEKLIAHMEDDDGDSLWVTRGMVRSVRMVQRREGLPWELWFMGPMGDCSMILTGDRAVSALGRLMPVVNRFGGAARHRDSAVELLEQEDDPVDFLQRAARYRSDLGSLPTAVRLAAEMAAQEEAERIAVQGDLALLELAWRDAEELAAIADSLLIPPAVHDAWMRLKDRIQGA